MKTRTPVILISILMAGFANEAAANPPVRFHPLPGPPSWAPTPGYPGNPGQTPGYPFPAPVSPAPVPPPVYTPYPPEPGPGYGNSDPGYQTPGYPSPGYSNPGYFGRQTCFEGGAGERGRLMGVRNATRLVNSIWARLGQTCDQLDRLAQIVSETPLSRPMIGGQFAACFYLGYTDALFDQVGTAYDHCQVRCFNEGTDIGRISAQGYCAASEAVGGLFDPGFISQPPLPFCGENLVMGCKTQYVVTATQEIPACFDYTTGNFAQTFDNSVRQDCFVPSDVPIRGGYLGFTNSSALNEKLN